MAGISDIVFSLALISIGLIAGYSYRNICPHGRGKTEEETTAVRKKLQAIALLYVNPVAFGGAIWALKLDDIRIISLPFLGAYAILFGGVLAYASSKILKLSREQNGVFVICGGLTNIGSIGSLVVYILLGEGAVALMPFYKLFESFLYYGIGFPYAKSMSSMPQTQESRIKRVTDILSDKYVLVTISSVFVGLGLNLLGFQRPRFYSALNSVLIPLGTLLLLSSIGMAMRFGKMRGYLREAGILSFIKFVAVPGTVYILGSILGLGSLDGGLPLKVAVVLAAMPVAFTAMVPPTLYDLDVDLANTAWFVTTALLLFVIPALWFLLG